MKLSAKRLTFCFIVLFQTLVYCQETLDITDTSRVYSLSGITQAIEDPDSSLHIQDILTAAKWKTASTRYSYDFTNSIFWTRSSLLVNKAGYYKFYLDYNGLNKVDFFVCLGDSILSHQSGGNSIAYHNRSELANKISCTFHANTNSEFTIYTRIRAGKGASFFPSYAGTQRSFYKRTHTEELFSGLFYGISLIISVTFLFSFIFTRDKNYLLYSIVALIHLFNRLSFSGHADIFFGEYPLMRNYTDALSQCLGMSTVIYFIIYFLQTRKYFKWQHYGLVGCMVVMILAFIVAIFNPGIGITIGNNISPAIMIFSISAAYLRIKKHGYRPALYFLIGWGGFYVGVILLLLANFGQLPSYFVYAFEAGVLVEMVFFSMAVAENYKFLKEEQQRAQQEAYHALQENERLIKEQNIILEKKVKERTVELAEKNKEILDSIQYASRIQKSLLPNEKYIIRVLSELRRKR